MAQEESISLNTLLKQPLQLSHIQGEVYLVLQLKEDYIEAKWYGHIIADNVVCASKAFMEFIKVYPCSKLLNDKSEVTGGDWQEANDWLEFEWLPKATQAGLRCMAHVYSQNMFSRLSARDLYMRVSPHLHMQNFDNRADAEAWLRHCDTTDESSGAA